MLTVNRALAAPVLALGLALLAGCPPKAESCHSPSIKCGDKCVDASTDPANCGGCGVACGAGQTCCGVCVDTQTSKTSCGTCGHSCLGPGVADADASCSAGTCVCTGAATDCGGTCVDLATDRAHCGNCATACTFPGSQCQLGACGCFAPDPTECTSAVSSHPECTSLNDPQNCGTCGVSCDAPGKTACPAGNCACTSGTLTDCGALGCFDTNTDVLHCGGCVGRACAAGDLCCTGVCKDPTTNANCGSCGNACTSPQTCQSGSCACPTATPTACAANCCAGTGCCGTGNSATCKTAHGNGLGQDFFDCTKTYTPATTTRDAAILAAKAFGDPAPTDSGLCSGGFCIQGQKAGICAIWCYDPSPFHGQAGTSAGPCSALACPGLQLTPIPWPTTVP